MEKAIQRLNSRGQGWVATDKKHLKINGTRNYCLKTIGYCFRTKNRSPLILRSFFYANQPRILSRQW